MNILRHAPKSVLALLLACHGAATDGGGGEPLDAPSTGDDAACGTPTAKSQCNTVVWPRIAIVFGDRGAAGLSYLFRSDDGTTSRGEGPCDGLRSASSGFHCDMPYYAGTTARVVTVDVSLPGGAVVLSREITLMPFNYCGNGIAQVIASTGDGGMPSFGDVTYVTACGAL